MDGRLAGDSGRGRSDSGYQTPLVSAVITTHNRPRELQRAVESALAQTYRRMEIIVVDDHSGQETAQCMERLRSQHPRIQYIYIPAEESRGGNAARNRGIAQARGEYVAFLDDDDAWLPEKTERQLGLFTQEVGFVYCGRRHEIVEGSAREETPRVTYRDYPAEEAYTGDLSDKCFSSIFCTTSCMMVRRDLLNRAGGFDESLFFWQETDLCIRLCQLTRVNAVREPMMILRVNKLDPQRLSNQYYGWLAAVEQINGKYSAQIASLPAPCRRERRLMTLKDQLSRCENAGLDREKRRTLLAIWKITRDPKDLLRFALNRSTIHRRKQRTAHDAACAAGERDGGRA